MGTRITVPHHSHIMKLDKIKKTCKKGKEALKFTLVCIVDGCKHKTTETSNCVCGEDWNV